MVLADRPDLHVFLMRRTPDAVFGPGATVFPGGALDPSDASEAVRERVVGLDDTTASELLGLASGGLSYWVAAVRECFEEAGILLLRDRATGDPVDSTQDGRAARLGTWRGALNAGTASFAEFLVAEDLVLDARDLVVVANWLTPVGPPRRFDTWFFAAHAPDGQDGAHDDGELVESEWVRPHSALARHEAGEIDLIYPTMRSLQALARCSTAREFLAIARDAGRNELARQCPT